MLAIFLLVASPIWPLGENPIVGDPFLIVNVTTNQLSFFQDGQLVDTHSVATGKKGDETPLGLYTIIVKAENPYYRKKNIPGGDPKNPLGSRWIGFDANDTEGRTYGVHGTNRPDSIGKSVTAGCLRLPNELVEKLFERVPLGTKILITDSGEDFYALAQKHGAI